MQERRLLIFLIQSATSHRGNMQNIFTYLQEYVPSIGRVKLSAHCHDDLGMATANSLAAILRAQPKLKEQSMGLESVPAIRH